ncbi:MAG: bifunctional ADP-heptose synthase [Nanoarchaeota archaeon]
MENSNLEAIIDKFAEQRIVVVGDLILDEFRWGKVVRINPEMPSAPLVDEDANRRRKHYIQASNVTYTSDLRLGGAGNVARNIVGLGGEVYLFGVVGDDMEGKLLLELARSDLNQKSYSITSMRIPQLNDRPTTKKFRVMAHGQQIVRVDTESREDIPKEVEDEILLRIKSYRREINGIVLSDYAKGVLTERLSRELIQHARSMGIPVIVDPKPKNFYKFSNPTLIKPNLKEAEHIVSEDLVYETLREKLESLAKAIKSNSRAKYVAITCGEKGIFVYDGTSKHIPAPIVLPNTANSVGAGDTSTATIASALSAGADIYSAAKLAVHASTLAIQEEGTATVILDELRTSLKNYENAR